MKIGIIGGAGLVGSNLAFALQMAGVGSEIVLVPCQRSLELHDVAGDHARVQPEGIVLREKEVRNLEIAAQRIEGLLEDVPGPLRGAVRPEMEQQVPSAPSPITGCGQERQKG